MWCSLGLRPGALELSPDCRGVGPCRALSGHCRATVGPLSDMSLHHCWPEYFCIARFNLYTLACKLRYQRKHDLWYVSAPLLA